VVDDHPLFREALVQLIRAFDAQVEILEAATLAAALSHAAGGSELALVVLDLTLPDATEIEAVVSLLGKRPDLPVLVLSAKDDPETVRAVLEAGARGFVSKRSPTRVLADTIRLALGEVGAPPGGAKTDSAPKPGDQVPPDSGTRAFTARPVPGVTPRRLGRLGLRPAW
jgi:DNA-binding NarL/FixJ family response regulator